VVLVPSILQSSPIIRNSPPNPYIIALFNNAVVGNLLVYIQVNDDSVTTPSGWTLVASQGTITVYSRIASGTSADNFTYNGTTANILGLLLEYVNSSSIYTTTGGVFPTNNISISVTGPSELLYLIDTKNSNTQFCPPWVYFGGGIFGGRSSFIVQQTWPESSATVTGGLVSEATSSNFLICAIK
ncbi:MAG: hypothetical protein ACREQ5_23635, partial [Candidatus Dormibacteria bacterium]